MSNNKMRYRFRLNFTLRFAESLENIHRKKSYHHNYIQLISIELTLLFSKCL